MKFLPPLVVMAVAVVVVPLFCSARFQNAIARIRKQAPWLSQGLAWRGLALPPPACFCDATGSFTPTHAARLISYTALAHAWCRHCLHLFFPPPLPPRSACLLRRSAESNRTCLSSSPFLCRDAMVYGRVRGCLPLPPPLVQRSFPQLPRQNPRHRSASRRVRNGALARPGRRRRGPKAWPSGHHGLGWYSLRRHPRRKRRSDCLSPRCLRASSTTGAVRQLRRCERCCFCCCWRRRS